MAKTEAQMAFDRSEQAKNQSEQSRQDLEGLITRISDFLGQKGARPADIRAVGGLVLVFAYQCFLGPDTMGLCIVATKPKITLKKDNFLWKTNKRVKCNLSENNSFPNLIIILVSKH